MARMSSEYRDDKKNVDKINEKLRLLSIDDYDLDGHYEFDSNLPLEENIIRKFILKKKSKDLKDNTEYKAAIKHNLYLLNNSYFVNDYFPYRHLAINYEKDKKLDLMSETISKFFKSGIYAHPREINWFIYKLIYLEEDGYITKEEIDSLFDYYDKHGALNKHKEHDPIFLADRIFQRTNGDIKLDNQFNYEKQEEKYALKEEGRYLEHYKFYDEAIDFYLEIVNKNINGATEAYKRLAYIYEIREEWENEFEIIKRFYQKKYNIVGENTKKEFEKRIKGLNKGSGSSYTKDDFIYGNLEKFEGKSGPHKNHSNDELLFKYAELYEKGLLTREEFDKKKKELL